MKKSMFQESQIVIFLKDADSGVAEEDLSRQHSAMQSDMRAKHPGFHAVEIQPFQPGLFKDWIRPAANEF